MQWPGEGAVGEAAMCTKAVMTREQNRRGDECKCVAKETCDDVFIMRALPSVGRRRPGLLHNRCKWVCPLAFVIPNSPSCYDNTAEKA